MTPGHPRDGISGCPGLDIWPMTTSDRPARLIAAMNLTPSDQEKLLLAVAGMVARDRLARGVLLNYPESVALLATWVIERAREGGSTVEDLMREGRTVLTRAQLMEGVPEMLDEVQVEATFPDGRKLVTVHNPVP
jgi:urease subunit gamma